MIRFNVLQAVLAFSLTADLHGFTRKKIRVDPCKSAVPVFNAVLAIPAKSVIAWPVPSFPCYTLVLGKGQDREKKFPNTF
jgi:hypothetical protein